MHFIKINTNYFVGNDKKNYPFAFKRVVAFVIVVAIVMSTVCSAFAAEPKLSEFCLVDNGKHLDWDGNSNYMNQFTTAVNTWNAQKSGVIRKDTFSIIQDVGISDYWGDESTIVKVIKPAFGIGSGKIKFNQRLMDTFSSNEKTKACLYALGLALGLYSTGNDKDVMYRSKSSVTKLSTNDINAYAAARNLY